MTDLKPKIFIGSSSSGYEVAEEVKKHLEQKGKYKVKIVRLQQV